MLIEAAIVYPTATPKRFRYWMKPQTLTFNPPVFDKIQEKKKFDKQLHNYLYTNGAVSGLLTNSPRFALTASM